MKSPATIALGLAVSIAASGYAYADHLNIDVEGAKIEGDSIVFPAVKIDKDGYVVIHAVEGGNPVIPASIGHTAVPAGDSENVSVAIEGGAKEGTDYVEATPDNAANGTYPLSRFLYVYVNKKPGQELAPIDREFVKLVLSKVGQEVVVKDGYIPLPAMVVEKQMADLGL